MHRLAVTSPGFRVADAMDDLVRLAIVVGEGSATIYEILRYSADFAVPVLLYDTADTAVSTVCAALAGDVESFGYGIDDFSAVLAAHEAEPFYAITTFSEDKIRTTAYIAAELGLDYHSARTARIVTDKAEQRAVLGLHGLGIPHRVAADAAQAAQAVRDIGVTCVVKPMTSSGSSNTYSVDPGNADQTHDLPHDTYPAVVEMRLAGRGHPRSELLGDIVSVETVFMDGQPFHFAVCDHFTYVEPFRHAGMVTPSQLPADLLTAVTDTATRALQAAGVSHGASQVELKLTPTGPVVIEINGRLGGYVGRLCQLSTGVHAVELALRAVCGQPVPHGTATQVAGTSLLMSPVEATRLESRVPVEQVRLVEGVVAVDVRSRPGTEVDYRTGWWSHIACIWYQGPDLAALSTTHRATTRVVEDLVVWS